jgi:NADPH:quinone reductase-like Zn-dependent oxidoreductase/NAD-dependent SIR2 family protein deacetylase
MKAVVLNGITPKEQVCLSEVPVPKTRPGWVLVRVKAFGMNHSEQILRQSEIQASYIHKPVIPGIECAGEIADPSDSGMKKGQKVIAMMGGMGRSFDGSYAEYALLPKHLVFAVDSDLAWEDLAAVPETYFTAWGSLFECLQLKAEDTLLVRGATCALGYAAIQIAKALGCRVVATTHKESKRSLLSEADEAVLDTGILTGRLHGITKALDLVGPRYLKDTLTTVEKGGIVCNTGILGGVYALNGFDPIKDIPNGVYLTGFFSNYPTQEIVDDMFAFFREKKLLPIRGKVFDFEAIADAVDAQERGLVNGKIVVKMPEPAKVPDEIRQLKQALEQADAVIIGAGAGLSTSAGFIYTGERFRKYFQDFAECYGFRDMYSGGFYPYQTLEEHWAYWSRYIYVNRYMDAPKPVYDALYALVKDKDYFVLTTNVDHCFQKAGFEKHRLFYTQGDYGLFQCSAPCHAATYDNREAVTRMVEAQGYRIADDGTLIHPEGVTLKMQIPSELVPRCPKCGRPMTMNLRSDDKFVEDDGWHIHAEYYTDFLHRHSGKKVVFLELGVGYNTPGIIKFNFWRMTNEWPQATYVCINYKEAYAPDEIREKSICISGDIGEALSEL